MKFKKWLKMVDPVVDVVIWTQDDSNEPAFEGSILDIPWGMVDWQIGRIDDNLEKPIYISKHTNKHGCETECIVVNLIAE